MSSHSSIPGEPVKEEDLDVAYPPRHPVPCMQAAFEESMYEQGHQLPTNNPYAITTGDSEEAASPAFIPRYHPLTKLVSQITFGIHLLHKRLAKSDSEVVRILQSHVNDMDNFLSTTTHDFDLARSDISARIRNLQVPLESGPASEVFESMLRDSAFRAQIMEGNKKVEYVIKRTARAMNRALEDVGQGLRAVDELAKYLLTLKTGWKNANLVRVYGAMTHNVEGWFRCFVGLQMKGQVLSEKLNQLKTIVWEIERRCGRVSRKESLGGRNSSVVVRKRQSLNKIPENPSHESQALKFGHNEFEDKSLPTTPTPTPVVISPSHALWPKPKLSGTPSEGKKNSTPKQSLSKRRSVSGPLPIRTTSLPKPNAEAVSLEKEAPKPPELSSVPDEKDKEKKLKKKHRRSQSSVTVASSTAGDLNGVVSRSAGLAVSLRRSLSFGRSGKKEKEKEKRDDAQFGKDGKEPVVESAELAPAAPAVLVRSEEENKSKMDDSPDQNPDSNEQHGGQSGLRSRENKSTAPAPAEDCTSETEGDTSIRRKKSKAHLHHPSGQYAALQKRKSLGSISPTKAETTTQSSLPSVIEKYTAPPTPPLPKVPPTPSIPTSDSSSSQTQPRPTAQPTAPKSHSRRQSIIGSTSGSVLNSILSLRPKSRHGGFYNATNKEQTNTPKEIIPPVPALPHQIKSSSLTLRSKTGSMLSKPKPNQSPSGGALMSTSTILKSVKELQDPKNLKNGSGTRLESKLAQPAAGRPAFKLGGTQDNQISPTQKQPSLNNESELEDVKLPVIVHTSKEKSKLPNGNAASISNGNPNPLNTTAGKGAGNRVTRAAVTTTAPTITSSPKSPNKGFLFKFFNDRSF